MAWQTEMIQMLRTEIGDEESTPVYSDSRLERLIVNSAKILIGEFDFANDYTVTISTQTISPDPIDLNDDDFVTLVIRRAICRLARGVQRISGTESINVRDGSFGIDGTGPAREAKSWADEACKEYDRSVFEYSAGRSAGKAIIGPHRTNSVTFADSPRRDRSLY